MGRIAKPPDGKTSLSEGGACHMGRAARLPQSGAVVNTRLCRKIYSNFTHVVARCFESTGSVAYTDLEMEREMSAAPDWMVQHMKVKRTRCNAQECSAASEASKASAWKTELGSSPLPHGPEVSYGIPFRWSAARLLASDMRSLVCSSLSGGEKRRYHNDSAACDALLNMSAWTTDGFFPAYAGQDALAKLLSLQLARSSTGSEQPSLLELHRHMMGEANIPGLEDVLQRPDEDYMLWDGDAAPAWVACNQRNGTCYGKISRSKWYESPGRRADTCIEAFNEQVGPALPCFFSSCGGSSRYAEIRSKRGR